MSKETHWGPLGPHDWVVPDNGDLTVDPEDPTVVPEPEPVPDSDDDDDAFEPVGEFGAEASTYIPRYVVT